jgi:hypothetical protein
MSRTLPLPVVFLGLLALACSDEPARPIIFVDNPTVESLGAASKTDGGILLSLQVLLVSHSTGPMVELVSRVQNKSSQGIRYDSGGCGCPTPSARLENSSGEMCRVPRTLCPCWTEIQEIAPGEERSRYEIYPLGSCTSGPGEAISNFGYSAEEVGEWVVHGLEVRLPIVLPEIE